MHYYKCKNRNKNDNDKKWAKNSPYKAFARIADYIILMICFLFIKKQLVHQERTGHHSFVNM